MMASIQKQFESFHADIRTDYQHSATLREKRDIVCGLIDKYLAETNLPSFKRLLQGSYKMKTGVIPIAELEYDIDIGLRWFMDREDYDPEVIRSWIFEAVDGHTKQVVEKGPCIRVVYSAGFHLDLVAYVVEEDRYWLAHRDRKWVPAEPVRLQDQVREYRHERFSGTLDGTKTDQFRRVVRYLRRWNDTRFPCEHPEKPCGLAFVLLAMTVELRAHLDFEGCSDDLGALESFLLAVCSVPGRLQAVKRTQEYEDLLAGLDDNAMGRLKLAFGAFLSAVQAARQTSDPVAACEGLAKLLDGFPIPSITESAITSGFPAIVPSSHSG